MMTEAYIQRKIIKHLEGKGAYVVNVVTASKAGVPDLLVCYEGHFVGLEVKIPKKRSNTTALQRYNIDLINHTGGLAGVVTSVEDVEELLKELE